MFELSETAKLAYMTSQRDSLLHACKEAEMGSTHADGCKHAESKCNCHMKTLRAALALAKVIDRAAS